jgi:hypothetical protein
MHKSKSNLLKKSALLGILVAMLSSLLVPTYATSASITNGTFETGAPGDTTISGWTALNQRIDLGVDSIAGCLTSDTSDYSTLRDYASEWSGTSSSRRPASSNPTTNNDSLVIGWDSGPSFTTTLRSGTHPTGTTFDRVGSQILELFSTMNADSNVNGSGYVVHGPAVYSQPFTAKTIDDLSIAWAATNDEDDYHVFGYLQNTADCSQTEVIDSTGRSSVWQTTEVAIPSNGTYRFVFVSGTFDQSFGTVAGAYLYLDDIVLSVNEVRAAEEAALASPASPKIPFIDQFNPGPVLITPGQTLSLTGSRLHCTTYAEINSQRTTVSYSSLPNGFGKLEVAIPSNLPAGNHKLTIDSCGGPVNYLNMLVVSKPPVMKEGRFSSRMEQARQVQEIRDWVLSHRADYNSVQCISNTMVPAQERARQFANDICKQALGLLASPKGSEVEIRDKSTHIAVWFRIFLLNK